MNTSFTSASAATASSSSNSASTLSRSGFGLRRVGERISEAAVLAVTEPRYSYGTSYAEIEADLDALIEAAIAAIVDGDVVEDEILGHYVSIASLVRAVSFREGKLLEQAVERIAKVHPDLVVLSKSLKLPLVRAAMEAVANNSWMALDGVLLDCDAPAKGSYTPDLIIVNRARHLGYILDLKRSLASYGDTSRLDELKAKMMAGAMVLPDWLYKHHKRMMVDTVGVAIVDGASRPSDHEHGIWALNEIDDLLEISGAAATLTELRRRFAIRVQDVLARETRKALGVEAGQTPVLVSGAEVGTSAPVRRPIDLNSSVEIVDDSWCHGPDVGDQDLFEEDGEDEDEPTLVHPVRLKIGFARSLRPT